MKHEPINHVVHGGLDSICHFDPAVVAAVVRHQNGSIRTVDEGVVLVQRSAPAIGGPMMPDAAKILPIIGIFALMPDNCEPPFVRLGIHAAHDDTEEEEHYQGTM
jgi:hypothetical protein